MNALRELWGVVLLEWRRLRASPRVVVLVILYLAACGLTVFAVGRVADALQAKAAANLSDPSQVDAVTAQARLGVLGYFFEGVDDKRMEVLVKIPLVVFIAFRASLFFAPIWLVLLGYDVVSDELTTRSIRYVTLRARRSVLVVGKFLALSSVLAGMMLVVNGALMLYARQGAPEFTGTLWWVTLLRCWGASSLFTMGYLALTLLCSTLATPSSLALALNLLALLGLWVMNFVGSATIGPGATAGSPLDPGSVPDPETVATPLRSYLQYATPSHYGPLLLHPDSRKFAQGAAAFLIFMVLFVTASAVSLQQRDV